MTKGKSVSATEAALSSFAQAMCLEEADQTPNNIHVFHLILGLLDFCEINGIDFMTELRDAQECKAQL